MKKILVLTLFGLALFSCKRDNKLDAVVARCNRAGILYNQLLDTVFNDVWKSVDTSEKTITDDDYASISYNSFMRSMKNLFPEEDTAAFSKDRFKSFIGQVKPVSIDTLNLTEFQKKYYDRLIQSLDNVVSLNLFLFHVLELEREIVKNAPTPEEAEIILTATSIARHSAQYWPENIYKWGALASKIRLKDVIPSSHIPKNADAFYTDKKLPKGYYPYPDYKYPDYFIHIDVKPDSSRLISVMKCPDGAYFNPVLRRPEKIAANFPNTSKLLEKLE
jgi:hypothetical protein